MKSYGVTGSWWRIGEDAGRTGEDAGRIGKDAGRIGEDAGRIGEDAGRTGEDAGRIGEELWWGLVLGHENAFGVESTLESFGGGGPPSCQ